jgi:transcriptional regulator with XRE-family HTH domain
MDIRETFGANVRRYHLRARLSQEALAERMGVDRAYISLIERGQQNATLLTIWHAAQALEILPVDLLSEGSQTQTAPNRRGRVPSERTKSGRKKSR